MLRYETLVLTPPDITREQIGLLENQIATAAKDSGGRLMQFDEWGKYYLAYPVKKNNYGCYFLARVEIPEGPAPKVVSDLTRAMQIKCVDYVWRHVIKKLEAGASLEYTRPESVASTAKSKFDRKPGEFFERSASQRGFGGDQAAEDDQDSISEHE